MHRCLVTGAGGFIGGHLARALKRLGHYVVGADIKRHEYFQEGEICDEFVVTDLRMPANCELVCRGMDWVFQLACDMGGLGWISSNEALLLHNNILINTHMIEAARVCGVKRYFFSSSACVYPEYRQMTHDICGLREHEAYPAQPDLEYGWEKLIAERMCKAYEKDFGLEVRIARFHNIFYTHGTWSGGREKAPCALLRKVLAAKLTNQKEIEVWGTGEQTRSFLSVTECVEGVLRLMSSDYSEPLNIGSDEIISVNNLVQMISEVVNHPVTIKHVSGPMGVMGRNSDNTLIAQVLGWRPCKSLRQGLAETMPWILDQLTEQRAKGVDLSTFASSHIVQK